jgi:hypothetical protein
MMCSPESSGALEGRVLGHVERHPEHELIGTDAPVALELLEAPRRGRVLAEAPLSEPHPREGGRRRVEALIAAWIALSLGAATPRRISAGSGSNVWHDRRRSDAGRWEGSVLARLFAWGAGL